MTTKEQTLEDLIGEEAQLRKAIQDFTGKQNNVLQLIAQKSCPLQVGQVIYLSYGLGINGLKVESIETVGEKEYSPLNNRWAVTTVAIGKNGEPTKRSVFVTEEAYLDCGVQK